MTNRITLTDREYDQLVAEPAALRREVERLTLADRQWADHVKQLADERDRLRMAILAYDDALYRDAPFAERRALLNAMVRLAGRIRQV